MKLQQKLIWAFSFIVLLMVGSQSLFLHFSIKSTFQDYLEKQHIGYMDGVKGNFQQYYKEIGSWDNVQSIFSKSNWSSGTGHGMMRGMYMNMVMSNVDVLLLDNDGYILANSTGSLYETNANDVIGVKEDLIIDGEKKGTLVFHEFRLQELESNFLQSAKTVIIGSGLAVTVMAVFVSIWLAKKILNPLTILMNGINQIAKGEKAEKVRIKTKDEFRELGNAFNEMSDKLEKNEEIRQSLVADVSHELRTPLTVLQGKLESIQEGVTLPTEEIMLEMTDEVFRLNRLVNDLQQLSLAEAGQLQLNLQPIDIKELINRICHHLQWLADEKEISLHYESIPGGFEINLDQDRMTQVIVNLLGNALRHTPEKGFVEVTVMEEHNTFVIQISNTGPNIPREILPLIFNRFYKRDLSRSRNESGTGLGLSIAKGFVEAHGGNLTAESEKGKMTVFTVRLPKLDSLET